MLFWFVTSLGGLRYHVLIFLSRNPSTAASAYGVHISQFIWYFRPCIFYDDFLDIGLLKSMLFIHEFKVLKLRSSWCNYNLFPFFPNVTKRVRLNTGFVHVLTLERRRVPHVEQNVLILLEHLILHPVYGWIFVAKSLGFHVEFYVLLCVSWCFYHCRDDRLFLTREFKCSFCIFINTPLAFKFSELSVPDPERRFRLIYTWEATYKNGPIKLIWQAVYVTFLNTNMMLPVALNKGTTTYFS